MTHYSNKKAKCFVLLFNVLYRIEHDIAAMPETVPDSEKLALRQKRANRVFKRLRKIEPVRKKVKI